MSPSANRDRGSSKAYARDQAPCKHQGREDPTWAGVQSLYDRVHRGQRRAILGPPALRAGFDKHLGGLEITQARRRIGEIADQMVTGGREEREQADRRVSGPEDLKIAQIGSEAFTRSWPDQGGYQRVGIRLESV
jgi:hypothetical protein